MTPATKDRADPVVVSVMVLPDCPHRRLAIDRVTQAARNLGADVQIADSAVVVLTDAKAARDAGFHGSPTILVDGRDLFPFTGGAAISCRLYATDAGLEGAPSVAQLQRALIGAGRP